MAEAHRLDVVVSAVDKASAPLKRITGGFNMMSKQGLACGAMFAAVTVGMQAGMQALSKLQQNISESINKFLEFEKAMAEVNTMLAEMDEHLLPGMTAGINKMSIAFGKSAIDLSRGLYQILSAGVDAGQAMSVLAASSKLATATLTSVETAVDAVTTVLNAYNMSALQADYVTNIMAKTIQAGKLRMDELAGSIGYVVTIAAQAGVSFEEVAAAGATMTKQGISAQKAFRGLRQLINNLISPSDEAISAMAEMGIYFDDLTLQVEGISGVMDKLRKATHGEVGAMAQLIPNIQGMAAGLALTTADGELLRNTLDYLNDDFNALNEMFGKMADSAQFARDRLKSINDEMDRQKGEVLEPLGRAWDDFWFAIQKGAVTSESPLDALFGVAGVIPRGYDALNKLRDVSEKFTDEGLSTEKIESYTAHFQDLNDEADRLKNLLPTIARRQAIYQQEIADATEQRRILMATHDYTEALHYIPLALKDASYTSKIFDESTRALVDSIRIQREQIEALDATTRRYNMQTMASGIAQMEIQLRAMGRRGRMTRDEKRKIQDLQREDLKRRIATSKNQLDINTIKEMGLTAEEKRLEQIRTGYTEEVKIIQDSYNEQLEGLNNFIAAKEQAIKDSNLSMISIARNYVKTMETIDRQMQKLYITHGYGAYAGVWGALHPGAMGPVAPPQYQGGGLVPGYRGQPQLAVVHGGETISQAGKGAATIHIDPITVNANIYSDTDLDHLGQKIGQLIASGVISGLESQYRVG